MSLRAPARVLIGVVVGLAVTGVGLWLWDRSNSSPPFAAPIGTSEPPFPMDERLRPWDQAAQESAVKLSELVAANSIKEVDDLQFPQGEAVHSRVESLRRYRDWLSADWKTYLDRRGSAELSATESAFLNAVIDCEAGLWHDLSCTELCRLAKAVLAETSDPCLQLQAMIVLNDNLPGHEPPDVAALRQTSDKVLQQAAPRFAKLKARQGLLSAARTLDAPNQQECLRDLMQVLVDWIEQSADDPDQQRFIWFWIAEQWEVDFQNAQLSHAIRLTVTQACLMAKSMHPWLSHMLIGAYHHHLAWKHRGSGFADTVAEAGWEEFRKENQIAAQHFTTAWLSQPDIPDPAIWMIAIALGGDNEQVGTPAMWFQRAIDLEIDNRSAYKRLLWALEPRWGGSFEQMLKLAAKSLDTDRFDTYAPGILLMTLHEIQTDDLGTSRSVLDIPQAAELLHRLQEAFWKHVERRREAPDTAPAVVLDNPEFRTFLGAICLKAGEFNEARRALVGIPLDDRTLRNALSGLFEPSPLCLSALAASASDEPFVTKVFPKLRHGFSLETTESDFQSLVDDLTTRQSAAADQPAQRFFEHALAITRRAQQFQRGDWVPLNFDHDSAGWHIVADSSRVVDVNTLRLTRRSVKNGAAIVDSLNRFPMPFAVVLQVEQPDPQFVPLAGVTIGSRDSHALEGGRLAARHFSVDRTLGIFGVLAPNELGLNQVVPVQPRTVHQIRVKAWPRWYTFAVDGYRGFNQADDHFEPSPQVSFGSPFFELPPQLVRNQYGDVILSNIRIRKLTVQPPPPEVEPETDVRNLDEFARYYERELEFDPDDAWAKFILALVRYDQAKYQQVVEPLQESFKTIPFLTRHGTGAVIASCFEQLGQYALANEWYQKQQQDTPDEFTALCLTARFFASCPEERYRDGAKALQLADRAVELSNDQNRWKAVWARAVAQAELSRFDPALHSLDEAVSLAPETHKAALAELRGDLSQQKPIRHNAPELPTKP